MRLPLIVVLPAFALSPAVAADEFPEPFNTDPDGEGGPISAEEAAASFEMPEGFEITVFASEPEVQNPIAMAWDHLGRMWVAENYTYAKRGVRLEMGLRDRVLVFEDTDWDGVADKRTVFTDDVQVLTSVEVGRGGVWLMCPPQLLFVPDEDGDLVPDGPPQVMLDGFTVSDSNYHNFANGLRWGPDGWLYGRCGHSCPGMLGLPGTPDEERVPIDGGIWRFNPDAGRVEVLTHGTVNPWGFDWDEHGELFHVNTVIGHLWHMIPGAHCKESFGQSRNPLVFDRIGQHADHFHFDTGQSWTKSRGGAANDFGGGHSHIGLCIYQGGQLPEEWAGKALTWNQHGRRLNVERLGREGSGYVARHEPDAIRVGDPWFRGIDVRTGPDGSLFALDWSDTGECHEHTGVHRTSGRIYRISYGVPEKPEVLPLLHIHDGVLQNRSLNAETLGAPTWQYRRVLEAAGGPSWSFLSELQEADIGRLSPTERLRLMWIVQQRPEGWSQVPFSLADLLADPDEHIRTWAIRFLTEPWPLDTIHGPIPSQPQLGDPDLEGRFVKMAESDSSGLVRLTLASTLQRLPVASRPALAKALASHADDADDHNLPHMVWFGLMPLVEDRPDQLVEVAAGTRWPRLIQWIARGVGQRIEDHPGAVADLLSLAGESGEHRAPVLKGLGEAYDGWRSAPKPANWDEVAPSLGDSPEAGELALLFGDGRALGEIRTLALDGGADHLARKAALRSLIEARPDDLREVCEKLLGDRLLNATALGGLALFEDPAIGERLAADYRKGAWSGKRGAVIDVLSSRPAWAMALLERVGEGNPRTDITPFHARQIAELGDPEVSAKLSEVWGEVRASDEAKRARMAEIKAAMTPEAVAAADLVAGRALYAAVCASCHQLYGEGGKLGPDLTGSGRAHLDYLLENVVDPSAMVTVEYRMSTITMKDGRTLAGVVAEEDGRTITLRLLTDEMVLEKSEVKGRELSPQSIMPEGLIDGLSEEQRRDLLAYLMHPVQVE